LAGSAGFEGTAARPGRDGTFIQAGSTLSGVAGAAGGGVALLVIVVITVLVCRRKPAESSEGLVSQDGLETGVDLSIETGWGIPNDDDALVGHIYDNPLTETFGGVDDDGFGTLADDE
jgi:hypothetical protein